MSAPDNEAQQHYWNEPGGSAWTLWQERMDLQLAPLGLAAIEAVAPRAGEHVLDIGCGCGDTTLQVAELVGPSGKVTGVDISSPMLARARERATQSGSANTQFLEADAQVATVGDLDGPFDAAVSRFGVMFFADPVAAFAQHRVLGQAGGTARFRLLATGRGERVDVGPGPPSGDALPLAAPSSTRTLRDPSRSAIQTAPASIVRAGGWTGVEVAPCVRTMRMFGTDDFAVAVDGSLAIGGAARMLVSADGGADVGGTGDGRAGDEVVLG